ncbi:endonuclease domain-containing protein [Agrobacterium pusense]|uniref:endonuclease domain-containing protein n=1 Tax=Agrobacterium pusense TaxID=648995 RepID=UPI002F3F08DF
MDSAHKTAVIIRGTITAILFFAGFAFPLIWIAAAFFAYTTLQAFPDPEPDTPENMYRPRQSAVTADDPDWREFFLAACESPAETAFLEAMIKGYDLKPDNGILVAPGFELDMQTEYKPYRLDFLVNKWLVVEVDGAEWHSSPEAIERDGIRDEFFKAKGFSVLRIPAKTVFNTPAKAVDMVRKAVARGRQAPKVVAKSPPISVAKTFTNSMSAFGKFMDDVDANITKASAIDKAMGPARKSFETEKTMIESALDIAKRTVALDAKLASDPNLRRHYEAAHADLEEIMQSSKSQKPETTTTITIAPITFPETHPDPQIGAAILESYFSLTGDRKRYFDDARQQISKDPRLSPHVQKHLERFGCHATWKEISVKKEPFSIDAFMNEFEAKGGASKRKPPPSW